jgi:hypothetical protein
MKGMRLFIAAALLPACAAAPIAAPAAPKPVAITEPDAQPMYASQDAYYPPYALLFHEGQKWDFSVQLAMTNSDRPVTDHVAKCEVKSIEYMCDRRVSQVVCSDGNTVAGGSYTANMRGMWRDGFADATAELDDTTLAFERVPQPNMHVTQMGEAWCSSDGSTTLCVQDGKGLVGARFIGDDGRETIVGLTPGSPST